MLVRSFIDPSTGWKRQAEEDTKHQARSTKNIISSPQGYYFDKRGVNVNIIILRMHASQREEKVRSIGERQNEGKHSVLYKLRTEG